MPRRRPPAPSALGDLELPEELKRCWVEDWVRPDDDLREVETTSTPDPGTVAMLVARRRWKNARGEWAEAHGITPRDLSVIAPYGRPVFRDETRFLAQHPEARSG